MVPPSFALFLLTFGAAALCSADINYTVNLAIGGGSVTGDIVTDGTIGVLQTGNIIDWNLVLNNGGPLPVDPGYPAGQSTFDLLGPLSGSNSGATVGDNSSLQYTALSATATQLLFNFSDNSPTSGWLLFQSPNVGAGHPGSANGEDYAVCFAPANGACDPDGGISLTMDFPVSDQFTNLSGTQVIGVAAGVTPEPSYLAVGAGIIALLGFRKLRIK